ncbi:MAG: alpha/beta hydrolase [Bacteroidetes bacterium]|nr:alpha/beta hydrolase [Bacteroidota bacterium]
MKTSILFTIILIVHNLGLYAQKTEMLGINLEEYQYPYKVKFDTLDTQQQKLKMAYMYEVAGNSRGTVVLLHGKNFNGAYWGETIKNLLQKGYNVFVPDQIGFGKSSKPEYYQYSFQQLAENTRKVLDNLKITRVILLGHSMGGMLAVRFALMYPEITEQLILENPIGLEDWKKWIPYRNIDFYFERELKKTKESARQYMFVNYFNNQWKEAYDNLVYLQTAFLNHPDYPRLAWNSALTTDMILTQPVVYELGNLKVPTVLILGQLDRTALGKDLVSKEVAAQMGNYPKLGKEITSQIPGSQLIELPGIGHIPHIENFRVFFDTLMDVIKP